MGDGERISATFGDDRSAAAAHPGLDYPSYNNIGMTYDVQWYTLTSGHTAQDNLFGDQKFWRTNFLDAYKKHLPFKSLDSFVGNPSVNFQRILKHPIVDAYYDAMLPTREQFQKITLPVLTITAQYDGDELGALPITGIIWQLLRWKRAQNIFSSSVRGTMPARVHLPMKSQA